MSAAMVVPLKLTREQFAALPEPEHGGKMELVDGRLVIMTPVSGDHGEFASYLIAALVPFVGKHRLGVVRTETGYWLTENTMRAPDITFVSSERRETERESHRFIEQSPDLAIEIVSPGDLDSELSAKVQAYLAHDVRRVWIVRPADRSVTIYRPDRAPAMLQEGDFLGSDDAGFAQEGFSLQVRRIFEF